MKKLIIIATNIFVKHKTKEKKTARRVFDKELLCVLLGFFTAFLLLFPARLKSLDEWLEKLEFTSRDLRMNLRLEREIDKRIIIIGITDLEHFLYGNEISTREVYQFLLQSLQRLGVKAVIFDVLFEHPKQIDPTLAIKIQEIPTYLSYKFLTGSIPFDKIEQDMGRRVGAPPLSDVLADTMTTATIRETIYESTDMIDQLKLEWMEAYHKRDFDHENLARIDQKISMMRFYINKLSRLYFEKRFGLSGKVDTMAGVPEARFVVLPTEALLMSAKGLGFINIMKEREEVIRKVPLFIGYKDKLYPHIDLVFLCDYYGVSLRDLKVKFGEYIEFTPTKNFQGIKRIPIDRSGNVMVNFRRGELSPGRTTIPLHQVLHFTRYGAEHPTSIDPEQFKGAVVIVGEMSPGGTDVEPIPLTPVFPMVGIHATLINMIWKDDYLSIPGPIWEIAITLFLGLVVGLLFGFQEYRPASLASILVLVLYIALCLFLSAHYSLFLPFIRPAGTILLSYIFLVFYILGIKERERRKVRTIFMKSVSPRIGEEILKNYDNEAIWGTKKIITVLFVDIRGFTRLSERLGAPELVEFLDSYYDTVSQIIFSYDGVVNKFIGDAVLSLFGAPLELPDAETRAVKAALEIQAAVPELNQNPHLKRDDLTVGVGVGISTGEVAVGTVGRKRIRIEYTALGDNVNVADRLQAKARPGEILINAETYRCIIQGKDPFFEQNNIQFKALPPMMLKGKEKAVEVYQVLYPQS